MDRAARLLAPSVPDLDQAVLGRGGNKVGAFRAAGNPADQPGVGWRVAVGQLQLRSPDAESEILTHSGGSGGLASGLPNVQTCQLVFVLSHWCLRRYIG